MKPAAAPAHVAIIGMGPSAEEYMNLVKRHGGRRALFDETWVINALGDVLACDRIFHMDDVRIQEIRAKARPSSNIAQMLKWMKTHPGPIYTSRPHPDYPGLVPFPLQQLINDTRQHYLNSTGAYAIAMAVLLKVKKISIFGYDFTYPNAHDAEKGRACVEFWLGIAAARGIKLATPRTSSLLDACASSLDRLYGYDTLDVHFKGAPPRMGVSFTPKKGKLPTAAAIEARYDHSRHPNRLVEAAGSAKEKRA